MDISLAPNVGNEAQEQRTLREITLKEYFRRFGGEPDQVNLDLVKKKFEKFYASGNLDLVCLFYGCLHNKTKEVLKVDEKYRKVIQRLESMSSRDYSLLAGKINPLLEDFKDLFEAGRYSDARAFVDEQTRDQHFGLREKAPFCSVGYDAIRILCSSGKNEEARMVAELFSDFGFGNYLKMFGGTKQNLINNEKVE